MVELRRLYPEHFDFVRTNSQFDIRLEDEQWSRRLRAGRIRCAPSDGGASDAPGEGVETILPEWRAASRQFEGMRRPYLLY